MNPEDIWLDIKKEDDEAGNYLNQITIVFIIWGRSQMISPIF